MTLGFLRYAVLLFLGGALAAQEVQVIVAEQQVSMPAAPDCNSPAFWRDGRLQWFGSHGSPWLSSGPNQFGPFETRPVALPSSDNSPKWVESVWTEGSASVIWGWYHAEPVNLIPNSTLTAPKIGATVSFDGGYTMTDLGFILESGDPIDPMAQNGYFAGGHGDFSVILDRSRKYFYFFFGNYGGAAESQGVCLARMAYEDRANPAGKVWKYHNGAWREAGSGGRVTPIFPVQRAWQSKQPDAFWGPSVHWNTYLNCYVMLLNRAAGERWAQEGVYISFCSDLNRPETWTTPRQILSRADGDVADAGDFYAQVMGLDAGDTERRAGQLARLYLRGVSKWEIDFIAPDTAPTSVELISLPWTGTITAGETAHLSVAAMGRPGFTYRWLKDGIEIPGANSATLQWTASLSDTGVYQVIVKNDLGTVTSNSVTLTINPPVAAQPPAAPTPPPEAFLSNLSMRTWLSADRPELTIGFVVRSSEAKPLVLRAVGPALRAFGITDAAADTRLELFDNGALKIAENDNWLAGDADAFAAVGAFPLPTGSADAALSTSLPPGPATALLRAPGGGTVLAEVYDPAPATGAKVVNLSTLTQVGSGARTLIVGFTIGGTGTKRVLLRALGPQLRAYGLSGVLRDPILEVFDSTGTKIAESDDWDSALEPVFVEAGAPALTAASRDAALELVLSAGTSYTVQIRSADTSIGDALLEIYDLPSR